MQISQNLQRRFKGGLLKALKEAIMPGEKVWASLEGLPGQAIVMTDSRVIILKAGLASGAALGQKNKAFRLTDITSVEFSCAFLEGRVQITTAGSAESGHGFRKAGEDLLTQVASSRQAENVCQFYNSQREIFQELTQLIRKRIDEVRAASVEQSAAAPSLDIPEQISKLSTLARQGILTQAEFEEKKKELLARL